MAGREAGRRPPRSRWTSFIASPDEDRPRTLREEGKPAHRLRVQHNAHTLLVQLSDEDGAGWTVLAVDRSSREWAVAQARVQLDAAERAMASLYDSGPQIPNSGSADRGRRRSPGDPA